MLTGFFALGPLGYLLGFPFAAGLSAIRLERPDAIPWCWGVNGFASLIAPPLGLALAMSWGFTVAALTAVFLSAEKRESAFVAQAVESLNESESVKEDGRSQGTSVHDSH